MRYVPIIALALAATGCGGCEKKQSPEPQQIAAQPVAAEPAAAKVAAPAAIEPAPGDREAMQKAADEALKQRTTSLAIQQNKLRRVSKKVLLGPRLRAPAQAAPAPAPAVPAK
jgi:hypothetical protein